jgi:hypothetical protein
MPEYETQHVATVPPGWQVRTVRARSHEVRIAFPPGARKRGSGRVVEVLHPRGENPVCNARKNPMELLVMGANPLRAKNPIDNFTQTEKMYLGQLGFKWSEIKTAADVRRAKAALKKYCALKGQCASGHRRRNPESIVMGGEPSEVAQEIYAGFHADEADKTIRRPEPHMPSGDYAQLGTLYALAIKPMPGAQDRAVKAFMPTGAEPIRVVVDNSRRKIYFAGGDQSLSAEDLKMFGAADTNICQIGEARYITYLARKYHTEVSEKDRGKVVEWVHRFGEDGGYPPAVFYDRTTKRILLQGGSYEVQDRGIVN